MSQPRNSRRRVVTISSDEEDGDVSPERPSQDEEPLKPQNRSNGKLKPVSKTKRPQQPTPASSAHDTSSQRSPAKPKVSKAKSKSAVKDEPKSNAKPIYSFFNAATQRQRTSQPSASPEKPATQDEPETIHDDSGDDRSMLVLSKGSSTALAMRKRKTPHSASCEEGLGLALAATQKFRKTSDGGRTRSLNVVNEDKRPWTEQFAPIDLTELSVHKKKVADVRQWLDSALTGRRQKVLVLKGAAGTGKTTTIHLLAKDLAVQVSEWRNTAGAELTPEGSLTAAAQFEDFLGRAGRTGGLTLTDSDGLTVPLPSDGVLHDEAASLRKGQVLLIEEFPNTFSRTSTALQSFRSSILQYVSGPPVAEGSATPIVMIISETLLSTNTAAADSFTAHRLLGPELVGHPYINVIEFNPVAPTYLTKALEAIVVKEARKSGRRQTPGSLVLKRLAETGDIRSAVSSLEFLCLRGDDGEIWSSRVQFTKPKKKPPEPALTKAEEEALKLISNRESSLGIFHAVGRVVYNNRVEPSRDQPLAQPPVWLPQHKRTKVPERDIDALYDELGTDIGTFIAALHENYALSCSSSSPEETLDSLSECMDTLSDADLLSIDRFSAGPRGFSGSTLDSLRQDEMAFQAAVRGLVFSLPSPVHRVAPPGGSKGSAHRMFYPVSLKLWKAREEIEGTVELLMARAQDGMLNSTDYTNVSKQQAGNGVESWQQKGRNDTSQREGTGPEDAQRVVLQITKTEMLLERLPFQAAILSSPGSTAKPTLLDRILAVSRIKGQHIMPSEDDEGVQDGADEPMAGELWATDEPDIDVPNPKKGGGTAKGKRKQETEGGGLSIPVESQVERLVLEDDDIVDL